MNEPDSSNTLLKRSRKLRIFHSFAEAAEAEAMDAARKPPLEHIKDTVELILRVYGVTREELKTRQKNRQITIIRRQ